MRSLLPPSLLLVLLVVVDCMMHIQGSEAYPGKREHWDGDRLNSFAHWVQFNFDFNLGRIRALAHDTEEEGGGGFGQGMVPYPANLGDISQWATPRNRTRKGPQVNPKWVPSAHISKGDTIQKYMFEKVGNRTLFDNYVGEHGYWHETFLEHEHQRHHTQNQHYPYHEQFTEATEVDWLITTNSTLLWFRHALSHLLTEDIFQIEKLKPLDHLGDVEQQTHQGGERAHIHQGHSDEMAHRRKYVKEFLADHLLFPVDAAHKEQYGEVRLLGDSGPWCTGHNLWRTAQPHPSQTTANKEDVGRAPGWCFLPLKEAVPEALAQAYAKTGSQPVDKEKNIQDHHIHRDNVEDHVIPPNVRHDLVAAGVEPSVGIDTIPAEMPTMTLPQVLKSSIPHIELGRPVSRHANPNTKRVGAQLGSDGSHHLALPPVHLVYEAITRDMVVPLDKYEAVFRKVVLDVMEGWISPFPLDEDQEEVEKNATTDAPSSRRGGYRHHFDRVTRLAHLHLHFINEKKKPAEAWCTSGYHPRPHKRFEDFDASDEPTNEEEAKVYEERRRRHEESQRRRDEEKKNKVKKAGEEIGDQSPDEPEMEEEIRHKNEGHPSQDHHPWNPYQSTIVANKAHPITYVKMQQLVAHELFHHIQGLVSAFKDAELSRHKHDDHHTKRRGDAQHLFFMEGAAEAAVEVLFAAEGPMPRAKHLASLLLEFHPRFKKKEQKGSSSSSAPNNEKTPPNNIAKEEKDVAAALAIADFLVELDDYKQQISWRTVVRISQQWYDKDLSEAAAQMQLRREALVTNKQWPTTAFLRDEGKHKSVPYSLGKMKMLIAIGRWAPLDHAAFPYPLYHQSVGLDHTVAPLAAGGSSSGDIGGHPFMVMTVRGEGVATTRYRLRVNRKKPSVCVLPKLMDLPSHLMPGGHADPSHRHSLSRFRYHQDKWSRRQKNEGEEEEDGSSGLRSTERRTQEEPRVVFQDGVEHVLIPAAAGGGRLVKLIDHDLSHTMALIEARNKKNNATVQGDGDVDSLPPPPVPECNLLFSHTSSVAAKRSGKTQAQWVEQHKAEYDSYFSSHSHWVMRPLAKQWAQLELYTESLYTEEIMGPVRGSDWWRKPGDSGTFGPIN